MAVCFECDLGNWTFVKPVVIRQPAGERMVTARAWEVRSVLELLGFDQALKVQP